MNAEVWTTRRVLDWTRGHFEKSGVDAPRLTAELLLSFVLGVPRIKLYMDLDRPLSAEELQTFKALIRRRMAGEPTQYLTGTQEFYGRTMVVDSRVLIPRPETELLVEAALTALSSAHPTRVLDLCTGSGCVAISIAAQRPLSSVWASDLSLGALDVARANAVRHGVDGRVTYFEGDLFAPLPTGAHFDVIVSNPPYIRTGELGALDAVVRKEPMSALDGGPDGLLFIRRIIDDAARWLKPGGMLALEIGDDEGPQTREHMMQAAFENVVIEKDLARLDRLALGRTPLPPAEA
jgi:release factor glutamine methyltransferase